MESESVVVRDIVVESRGHCFLCLDKITTQSPPPVVKLEPDCDNEITLKNESFQSVQSLSRYLRMDMGMVVASSGAGEQDWDSQLPGSNDNDRDNSELKVELCSECALINERFSEVYAQLEKIKLEVKSWLKIVLGKLEQAGGTGKAEEFQRLTDHELGSRSLNKSRLWNVELLRKEAIKQCSRKLGTSNVEATPEEEPSETSKECSNESKRRRRSPEPYDDEEPPPPPPNRFECSFCQTFFKSMAAVNKHFTEAHLASVRARVDAQKRTYLMVKEKAAAAKNDLSSDNINVKREVDDDRPNEDDEHVPQQPSSDTAPTSAPAMPPNLKMETPTPPPSRKRKFECSFCEKIFSSRKRIYKHIANIHLGTVGRPVEGSSHEPLPDKDQSQPGTSLSENENSFVEEANDNDDEEEEIEEEDYDPEMETACVELISSIGDDDDDDEDQEWTWTASSGADPLSDVCKDN